MRRAILMGILLVWWGRMAWAESTPATDDGVPGNKPAVYRSSVETPPGAPAQVPAASSESSEELDAGEGFFASNVSFSNGDFGCEWIGEIRNDSGRDYSLANFVLSIYDPSGRLLDTAYINVSSFRAGQTKSFRAMAGRVPDQVRYKIQFENGL